MHGARLRTLVALAMGIAFILTGFAGTTTGVRGQESSTETVTPTETVKETPTPEQSTETATATATETETIPPTETVTEEPTETVTVEPTETETATETATATEEATPEETATATFSPATINPCGGLSSVETTDLAAWDLSETRSQGHNELVAGGLHVWTESNTSEDKAAGYYATDFALQDAGIPSIEFASYSDGRPSLQLGVDKDNDGGWDGYLVYEPWAYGDGNYWSSKDFGIDPGLGYTSFGTLNDYLAANPDARVISIGYSLGSGLLGEAVISKITAGCVEYTFTLPPPKPRIFVAPNSVTPGQTVDVSVINFDASESVRVRWRVGSSWVQVGTITTDENGEGATSVIVPTNAAAGLNSVRADGATKAQQTNAVMVTIPGPPSVELSTLRTTVNGSVDFSTENFPADSSISITWRRPGGSTVDLGTTMTDGSGEAADSFRVPATEGGSGSQITFASGGTSVVITFEVAPRIKVIPATVSPGQTVEVSLRGYGKKEAVRIRWRVNGVWITVATVTTSNTGSANVDVTVPAGASVGQNSVRGDGTVFRQQTNAVTVTP